MAQRNVAKFTGKINLGCYLMEQIYFVPLSNWCALS